MKFFHFREYSTIHGVNNGQGLIPFSAKEFAVAKMFFFDVIFGLLHDRQLRYDSLSSYRSHYDMNLWMDRIQ